MPLALSLPRRRCACARACMRALISLSSPPQRRSMNSALLPATGQSITTVSPANLATSGGVYVTISGMTLGIGTRSATVFFGPTMATTTSWVSFTSVIARAASGDGIAHAVKYYHEDLGYNVILDSGVAFDGHRPARPPTSARAWYSSSSVDGAFAAHRSRRLLLLCCC